jgi:PTS system nitrogen regulatory IIA component
MDLGDILTPDRVFGSLRARSKKQLLQELAVKCGEATGLEERRVLEAVLQREGLGSTAIGRGIAIPHGRMPGIRKILAMFARLEEPIDFDAPDGEPTDLIFLLLSPEDAGAEHLKALARISRLLRDGLAIEKLRATRDPSALYAVLTEPLVTHAG